MSKRNYRLLDNENASIMCGPGRNDDTGRELTTWTRAGNCDTQWNNGARTIVTNGPFKEICNVDPEDVKQNEQVAKSIYCKNGDFVVVADNIKFKAKNIFFEAEGAGGDGQIELRANGIMSLNSNETIQIAGGEVQIVGEKNLVLDATGFIYIIGDMKSSGAPSVVNTVKGLIAGQWGTLLSDISNTLRV
tara:strand:+ start:23189 stop:23758 length:570 start_codon:yes stop_codon:yes gene_type:complete